ncbi:methylmalonyl-CoA epimerase [Flavobacterium sp. CS20]|uniref:methylmalonyl-CoA epimerase n=1 Tax=Flavobacterium sp. CS20 TaxID=2775246 RepID=UPI001B3A345A|nr:methylmalonyl-CoA epimerase [Flavobacterium sp. CS20]QTY25919.1 methylmalonyl-CoA epimerase [Flavobacterium sp. CS20]
MMRKIEHLGIAVKDLEVAKQTYETLLGKSAYQSERVESEGVETVFFKTVESKIELLGATQDDSPIAKYLEKRGEGLHHIAFDVADIEAEIERLKSEGFQLISDQPKAGADNKRIVFLHPKSSHGVLVELCEEIKD